MWFDIIKASRGQLPYGLPDQLWFKANEKNRIYEGGMLMKILLFFICFILSVQFTIAIPGSFIEFSFASMNVSACYLRAVFFLLKPVFYVAFVATVFSFLITIAFKSLIAANAFEMVQCCIFWLSFICVYFPPGSPAFVTAKPSLSSALWLGEGF